MAAAPSEPIGEVHAAIGSVTVTRTSGVVVQVKAGDPVCQHDTIETGADGAVGIVFSDGTAFKLSNNARMALSEFVFGPNGTSNSALFNLRQGTFAFISGKVAKTGGLRIDTPIARIRATAQDRGIGTLTLAALTLSVMNEVQAASRLDAFVDDDTITYKHFPHGTLEIVTKDGTVILHDDPGETIQIDPSGSVTRIPNSSSRMAELQNFQQAAMGTLSQGPTGAAPGGSSTDTFNAPLVLQPINFTRTETDAAPPQPVIISTTSPNLGFVDVLKPPPPPTIAISTVAGQIGVAADNIINASKANAGIDITGTTSGVPDGRIVTITIVDSFNRVAYSGTATVTNGTWSVNVSSIDAKALADGSYAVTAIVSNPTGDTASASQAITVDETPRRLRSASSSTTTWSTPARLTPGSSSAVPRPTRRTASP